MRYNLRSGFSLVELLVVVSLIGLLIGLILPAIQRSREAALQSSCSNNLKQIGAALHNYHGIYGRVPPQPSSSLNGVDPNHFLGWMALILPQMEQDTLYQACVEACSLNSDPSQDPPHVGMATVIPAYVCPSDARLLSPLTDQFNVQATFTSYLGIAGALPPGTTQGLSGVFGDNPGCRFTSITDGLSQTIMVSERPPPNSLQAGWWYPNWIGDGEGLRGPNNFIWLGSPVIVGNNECSIMRGTFGPGQMDNPCDRYHLWSLHTGGANFLFADGSVRFLPYSTEPMVISLATRAGGEIVDLP